MAKVIDDIDRVLVDETEILTAVKRIASEIDAYYRDSTASGKKLLLLGILKGSVVFMGDLMKHITVPVEIDFMKVSSYGDRLNPAAASISCWTCSAAICRKPIYL